MKRAFVVFAVALAGSALLGAAAGLAWGALAPRVQWQIVAAGTAQQVNPEAGGYIAADAWYCLITAVGGLVTGIVGYRLLVRKDGWPAALGLVLGAVAAGLVAMWIGGLIGLDTFNHQLATGSVGTFFNSSLSLGAKSALVCWLLVTALVIGISQSGAPKPEPQVSGIWTPQAGERPRSVD